MLTVSDLTIRLRNRPVLKDLSFSLRRGEVMAIMGPSGCGKTTLLRAISGFVGTFDAGEITHHRFVWQNKSACFVAARKRAVTLLHQELAVWPHLSVRQQLDLVTAKGHREKKFEVTTDAVISALLLEHCADACARDLSGGEKQRLALGRALKSAPEILLLDEPFTALDRNTKAQVIAFLKGFIETIECGVILATHDPTDPVSLSAQVMYLGSESNNSAS